MVVPRSTEDRGIPQSRVTQGLMSTAPRTPNHAIKHIGHFGSSTSATAGSAGISLPALWSKLGWGATDRDGSACNAWSVVFIVFAMRP